MQIQPYLFFNGRCEEAIEFYRQALGGRIEVLMHFKDSPDPPPPGVVPPDFDDKVMHTSLAINGTVLMASDGCTPGDGPAFNGFSLSLNVDDETEAKRMFAALSDGGTVNMPLGQTFWSPCFGMLADRFGVGWMVGVTPKS